MDEHRGAAPLQLFETLLRMVNLVGYIAVVFRMPEIRRVIEYHGAEHKVIWAWERHYREMLGSIRTTAGT